MENLKTFLILSLLLFTQLVQSQEILEAEYFFDSDPGVNNGVSLSITTGDTIEFAENISTTGLNPGFHLLYIRVKDANNSWSLNEARSFSIQKPVTSESQSQHVVAAEYFIDTDPGVGNGTNIEISIADSISFSKECCHLF